MTVSNEEGFTTLVTLETFEKSIGPVYLKMLLKKPVVSAKKAILEAPFLELAHREADIPCELESICRTLARREGSS